MSVAIATAITPVIIYLWARAFPIAHNPEFASVEYALLKKRNGWIDAIGALMMFIGLLLPFPLIHSTPQDRLGYLFPLALGLMVLCHFAWVCAVTLPTGRAPIREFWHFYELQSGISMRGIKLVYVPLGALPAAAAVMLWL